MSSLSSAVRMDFKHSNSFKLYLSSQCGIHISIFKLFYIYICYNKHLLLWYNKKQNIELKLFYNWYKTLCFICQSQLKTLLIYWKRRPLEYLIWSEMIKNYAHLWRGLIKIYSHKYKREYICFNHDHAKFRCQNMLNSLSALMLKRWSVI